MNVINFHSCSDGKALYRGIAQRQNRYHLRGALHRLWYLRKGKTKYCASL